MTYHARTLSLGIVLLAAASCSKQEPPPPAAEAVRPAPAHAPAGSSEPATGTVVTGPVLETMDAASYTYVRVRGESGEVWAAAPQFPVKVGQQVRVSLEMPMKNFRSTALNRDFPLIYFVTKITVADGSVTAGAPAGSDPHGAARQAPVVTTPMPPPAGGMTIASVWAGRKDLAGKQITVHGVVVKYNPGILGVNWIHLQDGTGAAADGSNDITVTSTENVAIAIGDTVAATGTVAVDKTIGEGYSYPVLVEKARLSVTKKAGA